MTSQTFNQSSSYNRTYERKVVEEGNGSAPSVQHFVTSTSSSGGGRPSTGGGIDLGGLGGLAAGGGSPLHTIRQTLDPTGAFGGASFAPYNYKFGSSTSGTYHVSDDSFSATLDVSEFGPEDLTVRVANGQIIVEGKHGEKQDSLGSIERQFMRKFALPRNCHPDTVVSSLTADGQLTVKATAPIHKDTSPARAIPIKVVQGGAAASQNGH